MATGGEEIVALTPPFDPLRLLLVLESKRITWQDDVDG